MASLSFTHFLSLPRWHSNRPLNSVQLPDFRIHKKWGIAATSRKKVVESLIQGEVSENEVVVKKKSSKRRTTPRTRKKPKADEPEGSGLEIDSDVSDEESVVSASREDTKKTPQRTRRRAASASTDIDKEKTEKEVETVVSASSENPRETPQRTRRKAALASTDIDKEKTEKKVRRSRKTTRKIGDDTEFQGSKSDVSDLEDSTFISNVEDESEEDIDMEKYKGEDISFTYGWPPLVCCFGAALYGFVPSGRPANRLINYEIHKSLRDAYWAPQKFMRSPGGSAGSVAIALASLGGKVAFMGKLGDDDSGQAMQYYLNVNNVQTRSVCLDARRATSISQMKIGKRGRLRLTSLKPCAEDSLSKSEINTDVLKEAKMLYFSTHSLLNRNMRSTALQAIEISKKFGGVIFYDVNLPLPLWHSSKETKVFIQQAWNLADVIEVTKQELEFLCGVEPTEEFDTPNNDSSKFVHYEPEVVAPLWHENLKVLFVTNGTSKIHYYTKEHDGAVLGMEDAPLTPFTVDMSASGDGIVAGLMRMLTVQPDLITDKEYLERSIKYAAECGVIDQWLLGRALGFPPRDDMEEEVEPDENGIQLITEKEYRTVKSEEMVPDESKRILLSEKEYDNLEPIIDKGSSTSMCFSEL